MFLTADKIHDGKKFLQPNAAIEISDDGTIISIHENFSGEATHYSGIICPGFVNAHCHVELSHMKGAIPKHTGLVPFLLQVIKNRGVFSEEKKTTARQEAYEELYQNGIVAIGDIANTTDTLDVRSLGRMHIHTFVEALGFDESRAEKSFDYALKVYKEFNSQYFDSAQHNTPTTSLTPHAPYSVSQKLFSLISEFEKNSLLSIHNQESKDENEFYKDKTGAINDLLNGLNIETTSFSPSGKSSLQTYSEWIDATHPIIFVHDSFTKKEDVQFAVHRFEKAFFCLCPNANFYIENALPDVKMMMDEGATICIGTDSLASNDKLCIYSELQTLREHLGIDWENLLKWACYNGAKALQFENTVGHFGVGMKAGILQINNNSVKRLF